MNRKQFFILVVLVIAVGGAGYLVRQNHASSWRSGGQSIGQKLLPDLPVNDLAQITLKSAAGELNLAKTDNLWRVKERGNYPANFGAISDLLVKLSELKVAQTEEVGPSQLARFELVPPGTAGATGTGTLAEFKDATGKVRASLLLGKKHLNKGGAGGGLGAMGDAGWPDGRYVKANDSATVALVSDPLESIQTGAAEWLNKDFFHIDNPRSISVKFAEPTNSWKLTRASATNDWQLADVQPGESLDNSKYTSVTSPFSSASFSDVAVSAPAITNGTLVTVETFDGFTYVVTLGDENGGNRSLQLAVSADLPKERVVGKDEKPEDKAKLDQAFKAQQTKLAEQLAAAQAFSKWTFTVPGYVCDPVLKHRADLLVDTKKPAATEKTDKPE